jgi:hypothetical protein
VEEGRKAPRELDDKNKRAPHVNPARSGIRSGNPQLDPEHARKTGNKARSSHRPDQK